MGCAYLAVAHLSQHPVLVLLPNCSTEPFPHPRTGFLQDVYQGLPDGGPYYQVGTVRMNSCACCTLLSSTESPVCSSACSCGSSQSACKHGRTHANSLVKWAMVCSASRKHDCATPLPHNALQLYREVFPQTRATTFIAVPHRLSLARTALPMLLGRNHTLASTTNPNDPYGLSEQVGLA